MKLRAFIAVLPVTLLLFSSAASAQTVIYKKISVLPKLLYSINTGPGTVTYTDTAQEQFNIYRAYILSFNSDYMVADLYNLHPSPEATISNGIPQWYWWDYSFTYPQNPANNYTGTTGSVSAIPTCPDEYVGASSTISLGPPVRQKFWCEKTFYSVPEPSPKSCGVGNPIYPESGLKKQIELDYASPNGLLRMERTYRSDSRKFWSIVDTAFFDYSSGATYSQCVVGSYVRSYDKDGNPIKAYHCFPVTSPVDIPASISDGLLQKASGEAVAFNHSAPQSNGGEALSKKVDGQNNVTWLSRSPDNTISVFSSKGNLLSTTSHDGRKTSFETSTASTPASVAPRSGLMIGAADAFGRKLRFTYNAAGQLAQMTDPAGQIYTYAYDTTSAGCESGICDRLLSVTFPDKVGRQYVWDEASLVSGFAYKGLLTGMNELWPAAGSTPAQTKRVGSYGYGADGLAVSTQGARGINKYTVARNGAEVSVTDPLGATRTTGFMNLFGATYPYSQSQPAGSGCMASTKSIGYDQNANATSRDDFNGKRSCFTHDMTRNLEQVRVEGLSNSDDCGSYTAANAALPTGSRKTTTKWHPNWRLPIKVAEPGRIITSIYNGQPDPFNSNAIASCAPSTALLPDGKPIAVLCKQVEQATTDANGSKDFSATLQSGVANSVTQWTYNQFGQVLTAKDALNSTSTYAYYTDTVFTGTDPNAVGHTIGDLKSLTTNGQVTQYIDYDKHGNLLKSQDANAVVTVNTFDARQRLLSSKTGDLLTSYGYDPIGQLTKLTLPNSGWIGFEFDDAHRMKAVKDHLGNRIDYTLDNAGNRKEDKVKDPGGVLRNTLARSIDALNRIQQTTGQ